MTNVWIHSAWNHSLYLYLIFKLQLCKILYQYINRYSVHLIPPSEQEATSAPPAKKITFIKKWLWNVKEISQHFCKRKRKRSDSVLSQKPLHQQKCQKGKVTTQTTPQKSSIKQRLRTDLGRSVGVTKATQLVWLTGLRAHLPTNRNSRLIKRTHI